MRNGTRARAWLATVFAVVGLGLCVLTLVWSEWIELLFGVDPDAGSGALELLVAGAFLVASVLLAGQARRDWRIWHQGKRPIAGSLIHSVSQPTPLWSPSKLWGSGGSTVNRRWSMSEQSSIRRRGRDASAGIRQVAKSVMPSRRRRLVRGCRRTAPPSAPVGSDLDQRNQGKIVEKRIVRIAAIGVNQVGSHNLMARVGRLV